MNSNSPQKYSKQNIGELGLLLRSGGDHIRRERGLLHLRIQRPLTETTDLRLSP